MTALRPRPPQHPAGPRPADGRERSGRAVRLLTALAVAWVGFTVGQRALSGHWWPLLAVDLMPPIAFVVVPAGLAAAAVAVRLRPGRTGRGATAAVLCLALVALAVGWPRTGLVPQALVPRDPAPGHDLRIVSWNTEWWGQYATDRDGRFWAALRERDADVYLLQEYLNGVDHRQENLRPVDELDRIRAEFPGYDVEIRGELITISRFPIEEATAVGPGAGIGPEADWLDTYRAAKVLRTDISVDGQRLALYNVHIPVQIDPGWHLLTTDIPQMLQERERSRAAQFAGLEQALAAVPGPAVVAGDFNSTAVMGELDTLRGSLRDAARAGDSVYPVSWSERAAFLGLWRLDWAFTTPEVDVRRYDLVPMGDLSDHRSQVIEVAL
ncbi:endonuclease/exonuclease/phosphatase family protein [Marinitenerispora sediminis]|uniref:Tat pathway signal protein n=1 Tax=Marinitenerispora sediminis TaxID=1931232 RepID=A0A368SZ69_9ACTN|nr:endonuclease/exonuclease/phosphatase family protein [Marinitenerispora sediminis]RCV47900.1 Tat pathway signal protein [Marinitenerispora sediminis]RCV48794.1 Tat pathway signal protein [Marinitenerispora sediminis]RCV50676.1 Tat pathway signal protein [Marinitenerispora sediminis]